MGVSSSSLPSQHPINTNESLTYLPQSHRENAESPSIAADTQERNMEESNTEVVSSVNLSMHDSYDNSHPSLSAATDEAVNGSDDNTTKSSPRWHTRHLPSSSKTTNIVLSLAARESTGHKPLRHRTPPHHLRTLGGPTLFRRYDDSCGGMASEILTLRNSLALNQWNVTCTIISRVAPRLIGIGDYTTPSTEGHCLRGRLQREREGFVTAGGMELLVQVFFRKDVWGGREFDARILGGDVVNKTLAVCWNDTLALLKELCYGFPQVVHDCNYFPRLLPFLFTLLAHEKCFDGAAALIEEILSLQSQLLSNPNSFYLGVIPDLYELWNGFSLTQMAQFCRILALLIFEPEDRQLMESATILKSMELLQLRRDRAARSGRDAIVDMNQAILLGDPRLLHKLLTLLKVMNFAPELRRCEAYHVMAHFPAMTEVLMEVGLKEIQDWADVGILIQMASESHSEEGENYPYRWGRVAAMLERMAGELPSYQNADYLSILVHAFSVAQQTGVLRSTSTDPGQTITQPVLIRSQDTDTTPNGLNNHDTADPATPSTPPHQDNDIPPNSLLFSQYLNNYTLSQSPPVGPPPTALLTTTTLFRHWPRSRPTPSHTPRDAANDLQFNALLLTSYQVEVLFVLCTLLNGRRKIDAQGLMAEWGLVDVLDGMFWRLSWGPMVCPRDEGTGIHGPGCECNPESALRVQFLRLLHNFCDRDCDNYDERGLLLTEEERGVVFQGGDGCDIKKKGLLRKIIDAFIGEPDDSPYKFWLASCAESYLRGSTPQEQLFAARSCGLLSHLLDAILRDRLHCAGSLQTAFDLLGELCKGNIAALDLLLSCLDDERFERLMTVAMQNLVDSNVFMRALLLTVERWREQERHAELALKDPSRLCFEGSYYSLQVAKNGMDCAYLTHSWWDVDSITLGVYETQHILDEDFKPISDHSQLPSDWFSPFSPSPPPPSCSSHVLLPQSTSLLLSPQLHLSPLLTSPWSLSLALPRTDDHALSYTVATSPPTIPQLAQFLVVNQARLLHDLLTVVNLKNINHENICCLNTAVVLAIFARRKGLLGQVIQQLQYFNEELGGGSMSRHSDYTSASLEHGHNSPLVTESTSQCPSQNLLLNFRELLWFWTEYYTHRGRDRLSLEFSSHLAFAEWKCVVEELCRDDGSDLSLCEKKVVLPKSPYRRAPKMVPERGFYRGY